ncbi:hypothetical protein [Rubrobacter tropicus]|nr:hypothetical protein [Rubrobacter tropicus]
MGFRKAQRITIGLGTGIVAAVLWSGMAFAYPMDLDPSFDGDGRVSTDFAPVNDLKDEFARDVAVQPDRKVVVAGEAQGNNQMDVGLARYNPDGSLDGSFGTGGRTTADLTGVSEQVSALILQPDGKIIVVGYASGGNSQDFLLSRFGADGSLDASFGTDGTVRTDLFSNNDYAYDVALQTDGKIVVSGQSSGDFALSRYNNDGSLDVSFDGDGTLVTDFGDYSEGAAGVALQTDGKIVAVGTTGYNAFALARYNPDGSSDGSFDGDGKLISKISSSTDEAYDVAVDASDRIVVAGSVNYNAALVRYDPDGTFDDTFGQTGKAINTDEDRYEELAIQPDGKIVARRYSYRWGVVRHESDGSRDASLDIDYGWGGRVYPDAYGMALQPDGKILLAGGVEDANGFSDFAVSRHLGGSDDAAPQTTITRKTAAATTDTYADFRSASSETRSTFECRLDSAATFTRCYGGREYYSRLAEGTHTFEVRATDAAGNTDPTPAKWTWKVDRTKPTGRVVINGGKASTASQRVFLKLTASDPSPASGAYQVRVKNENSYYYGAWQSLTPSKAWTLSPRAGTKTVSVQFRDRAGNVSTTALDRIAYRP